MKVITNNGSDSNLPKGGKTNGLSVHISVSCIVTCRMTMSCGTGHFVLAGVTWDAITIHVYLPLFFLHV